MRSMLLSRELRLATLATTARYEIRVKGDLDKVLAAGLPSQFTAAPAPAETVVYGDVDQSALHGMLDRLEQLGIELREIRRLPDEDQPD